MTIQAVPQRVGYGAGDVQMCVAVFRAIKNQIAHVYRCCTALNRPQLTAPCVEFKEFTRVV